jgi:hypothetical protein
LYDLFDFICCVFLIFFSSVYLFSDAVRANRLTRGVTDAEIESVTREWLRTARNRDGGRRQREATKSQQLSASVTAKTRRSVVSRTPSVSDEDISAESNVDEDT